MKGGKKLICTYFSEASEEQVEDVSSFQFGVGGRNGLQFL